MQNPKDFAQDWVDGWNSHDINRILAHYRNDIVFRSTKAVALTGKGELRGQEELRAYWLTALEQQPDLRFEIVDVFEGHEMIVISYRNHRDVLATETLFFDATGQVYQAAACHRAKETTAR